MEGFLIFAEAAVVSGTTIACIRMTGIVRPLRIARRHRDRTARNPHGYTRRRIRNLAVREANDAWVAIRRTAAAEKVWRAELNTQRSKDRNEPRQRWATEFEELAGHTWDGSWTPVEHEHKGYYANAAHWKALTDSQRRELINSQQPQTYEYMLGYPDPYSDTRRRQIARTAADKWIAEGSYDHRANWQADLEREREESRLALERKKNPIPDKSPAAVEKLQKARIRELKDEQAKLRAELETRGSMVSKLQDLAVALSAQLQQNYDDVLAGDDVLLAGGVDKDYVKVFHGTLGEHSPMFDGAPPEDDDGYDYYSLSAQ